ISQAFQEAVFQVVPAEERLPWLSRLLGTATKLSDPADHVGLQNELRSHLMKAGKPAFVEESFLSFAEARRLVLELGGIPIYQALAEGASTICDFKANVERLTEELKPHEVYAVKWIPVRNQQAIVVDQVAKMRAAGFLVTAGTEHNTLDLLPFQPKC